MNDETLKKLTILLNSYRILYPERKQRIFCRYLNRKAQKKLLFYLNPHKKWVMFWINHHGTKIFETLPTLKILADESKISVTKILIEKESDIIDKGIAFLIEICINTVGKELYNYEKFSRNRLKSQKKKLSSYI